MPDVSTTIDPRLLEQLPTLPGSAVEFVRLCDDPTAGANDVALVAQRDPGLVARILQVANSPFYSPREPVSAVTRAASILGLRNLKMIGVGFAILGELWEDTVPSAQLAGVIGASTIAGSGARSFSERIGTGRDEEAFTAGLLAFVGELALLRCYPDQFAALWDQHGCLPTVDEQAAEFGTDGAELGLLLMERWSIPECLRAGVEARSRSIDHRLRRTPDVFEAALGFGTAIAEVLGQPHGAIKRLRPAARAWGLSDDELLAYWSDFRVIVRRTNQQMGLDVGSQIDDLIVGAKEDYLSSSVHALSELENARREIDELREENERLEDLCLTDVLTDVPNRAAFVAHLQSSLAGLDRSGSGGLVGVAIFDLDRFKRVNDTMGHAVGDELLRLVAITALEAVRVNELFARLGGDEFAMVLHPSSIEDFEEAVERVRVVMGRASLTVEGADDVTVSAGAALLDRLTADLDVTQKALVTAADDALYAAKRQGRNRSFVTTALSTGLVRDDTDPGLGGVVS